MSAGPRVGVKEVCYLWNASSQTGWEKASLRPEIFSH